MIALISVDGGAVETQTDLPILYVAEQPPANLRKADVFLPTAARGRGDRLRQAFVYAFDTMGATGVITLPQGGCDAQRILAVAEELSGGASFVDGGLYGKAPFWMGGLFRILTTFTTGNRRLPWCGLRGYGKEIAPLLASVRYRGDEYETVLLQAAAAEGVKITDLPALAHSDEGFAPKATFRNTFFGAWGIFMHSTSLKFLFSSGVAFLIDYFLLLLLAPLMPLKSAAWNAVLAQAIVWVLSSQVNFQLNQRLVFGKKSGILKAMMQYYSLAIFVLLGKSVLLRILADLPLWIAKLLCEILFFLFNYFVQKKLIFRKKK